MNNLDTELKKQCNFLQNIFIAKQRIWLKWKGFFWLLHLWGLINFNTVNEFYYESTYCIFSTTMKKYSCKFLFYLMINIFNIKDGKNINTESFNIFFEIGQSEMLRLSLDNLESKVLQMKYVKCNYFGIFFSYNWNKQ